MKFRNYKVLFKEMLIYLGDKKGATPKPVSKVTGLPYDKLRNIRSGQSSAKEGWIEILIKHYPELKKEFGLDNEPDNDEQIEKRIKALEEENRLIKDAIIKLLKERGENDTADKIEKTMDDE